MCNCVCEREKEGETDTGRQTDRQTGSKAGCPGDRPSLRGCQGLKGACLDQGTRRRLNVPTGAAGLLRVSTSNESTRGENKRKRHGFFLYKARL